MGRITLFFRKNDNDIEAIRQQLLVIAKTDGFDLVDICLDDEPDLASQYNDITPALQIGPYRLKYPFDEKDINIAINSYKDREEHLYAEGDGSKKREEKLLNLTALEKFSMWLSQYYPLFIAAVIALFLGIAFLAPVLMKNGKELPARVIYKTYSFFCHELAFRSYFLYGKQAIYPREMAHITGLLTYEQITGMSANDTAYARAFVGNELVGYKVSLCERDLAIYGSMMLSAILFQMSKKKIRQLPWYLWIILGVLPIALDGGSQLFSLGGTWPAWFPIRESTPLLRTITGSLFGVMTSWYVLPIMEESLSETRSALARKVAMKKHLIKGKPAK